MQEKYLFSLLIAKIISLSSVSGSGFGSFHELTDPQRYNAAEMPEYFTEGGEKTPVNVIVGMKIWSIAEDTADMDSFIMRIGLTVKLSWYDTRLKYDSSTNSDYIYTTNAERIWVPPVVLLMEKGVSEGTPFVLFRIYPNSTVKSEITTHFTMTHWYDEESLSGFSFRLVSLKHTMDNLTLEWSKVNPLEITADTFGLWMLPLKSEDFETHNCTMSMKRFPRELTGRHSCLEVFVDEDKEMHKRSAILIVYIPGIFVVAISWACFWIEFRTVLGHIAILVACLLHFFVQKVTVVKDLSVLENQKALNIWFDACLGFVFAAFFAKIIVTYYYMNSNQKLKRISTDGSLSAATTVQEEEEECIVEGSDGEANTLCNHFHFPRIWLNRFPSTSDAINAICRVVFPLCFVIFLCVFFTAVL